MDFYNFDIFVIGNSFNSRVVDCWENGWMRWFKLGYWSGGLGVLMEFYIVDCICYRMLEWMRCWEVNYVNMDCGLGIMM